MTKENQNSGLHSLKAGGPCTLPGKTRSKKNALAHGISAKQLLLNDESQEDFTLLCRELQEILGAVGALENELILQLAMLLWRGRRLLKAETAEIRGSVEFLGLDRHREQEARAFSCINDLLAQHTNPVAVEQAIELLGELRNHFEHIGFDLENDVAILRKIYGLNILEQEFPFRYIALNDPNQDSDTRKEMLRTYGDIKKKTIELIDEELARIGNLNNEIQENDCSRRGYAELVSLVPRQEILDRLLRYESHLSREIDRVLNRLDRCKRLRLGMQLPPSITLTRA